MSRRLVAVADETVEDSWHATLTAALRPEFAADVYVATEGDPVLWTTTCAVEGCSRVVKCQGICALHGSRWRQDGKPPLHEWMVAAAGGPLPLRQRALRKCGIASCPRSAIGPFCRRHEAKLRALDGDEAALATACRDEDNYRDRPRVECAVPHCTFLVPPRVNKPEQPPRLCDSHYNRYRSQLRVHQRHTDAELTVEEFVRRCEAAHLPKFKTLGLPPLLALEIKFALQERHDLRRECWRADNHAQLVKHLTAATVPSLLDADIDAVVAQLRRQRATGVVVGFARFAHRAIGDLATSRSGTDEFARDIWRLDRLGFSVEARGETARVDFRPIEPVWLRELVKRWCRWRLNAGKRVNTVAGNIRNMAKFCALLAAEETSIERPEDLDRELLEDFATMTASAGYSTNYRLKLMSSLRLLLDDVRMHGWEPGIPADATYYRGELPKPRDGLPRYIPEYVMAQIERPEALDRISGFDSGTVLRVMIECGLRASDALRLSISPLTVDGNGAPFLRFINHKFDREVMIPVSDQLEKRLREQSERTLQQRPTTPWLFPRLTSNHDGLRCMSYGAWKSRLADWLDDIELKDELGRPVRVSSHQFRHTVGTRMVNTGVPLEVVRRYLDHTSLQMTERYARIHAETLRSATDKYIDRFGDVVPPANASMADASWMLTEISRVKQALPNGYCARPLQQHCPHPNACLTCDDFRTTVTFIPLHVDQLRRTRKLIKDAEDKGAQRIVEMNRPVEANLERIITTLKELRDDEST